MPPLRITPRQDSTVALFAGLTAVGAFVRIPLPAVPLTLQTAAVLLSGILLGPAMGALSQAVYVVTGLIGLPVFSQGGGPGYVLNPTFGYLIGFAGGAAASGLIAGRWRYAGSLRLLTAMLCGLGVIYLCGGLYLYWNLTVVQAKEVGFLQVAKIGWILPLPADLLKIFLLLPLIRILRERIPEHYI
jgi:biotin transport system substrate-specific component